MNFHVLFFIKKWLKQKKSKLKESKVYSTLYYLYNNNKHMYFFVFHIFQFHIIINIKSLTALMVLVCISVWEKLNEGLHYCHNT